MDGGGGVGGEVDDRVGTVQAQGAHGEAGKQQCGMGGGSEAEHGAPFSM